MHAQKQAVTLFWNSNQYTQKHVDLQFLSKQKRARVHDPPILPVWWMTCSNLYTDLMHIQVEKYDKHKWTRTFTEEKDSFLCQSTKMTPRVLSRAPTGTPI